MVALLATKNKQPERKLTKVMRSSSTSQPSETLAKLSEFKLWQNSILESGLIFANEK